MHSVTGRVLGLVSVAAVWTAAVLMPVLPVGGQEWVQSSSGPGPGDGGPRTDAILLRQMIKVHDSPARLNDGSRLSHNHPSMLCETRKGTLIFMWNGGVAEAEGRNRVWIIRKVKGSDRWTDPAMVEPEIGVDFGTCYQPRAAGTPLITAYWQGVWRNPQVLRFSYDDGVTWSDCVPFPDAADAFWDANRGKYRFAYQPPVEHPDGTLWWPGDVAPRRNASEPAIVVVPPDNYTGQEEGGSAWSSFHHPDDWPHEHGALGDLCVLGPETAGGRYRKVAYFLRHEFQGGSNSYYTRDGGTTWVEADLGTGQAPAVKPIDLDIPGRTFNGWFVRAEMGSRGGRNGMAVLISRDPLKKDRWKEVLALHEDMPGEDADPSIMQSRFDGKIHLLFTGRGEPKLKYYVLDPDVLVRDAPPARVEQTWPNPPANLKAEVLGPGRVRLTWQDRSDNEEGFRIWYKRFEEGVAPQEVEVPADVPRHILTALVRGRYGFRVQAFNASGRSQFSRQAAVTVRHGPEGGSGPSERKEN